ncbi:hypothetical protein ACFLRC_03330, partial [Candidatus Altiarchaeota archaeon]
EGDSAGLCSVAIQTERGGLVCIPNFEEEVSNHGCKMILLNAEEVGGTIGENAVVEKGENFRLSALDICDRLPETRIVNEYPDPLIVDIIFYYETNLTDEISKDRSSGSIQKM